MGVHVSSDEGLAALTAYPDLVRLRLSLDARELPLDALAGLAALKNLEVFDMPCPSPAVPHCVPLYV